MSAPLRRVYLLQRKSGKVGAGLSKTTGWIHRLQLQQQQVEMLNGVSYTCIDDQGLHIVHRKQEVLLPVDNVVICAGQESRRDLLDGLNRMGMPVHVIGGADQAGELDAQRAIAQGAELAARI